MEVWATPPQFQMAGITRGNIIRLCKANGITVVEKSFSLAAVYGAAEAFVTGTFAGVIPVSQVLPRPLLRGILSNTFVASLLQVMSRPLALVVLCVLIIFLFLVGDSFLGRCCFQ